MENELNDIKQFITLFLCLNSRPSDEQVHALASALGCDHASLEAVMYRMLASQPDTTPVLADSQEVTEGLVDPDQTPINDLASNDGDTQDEDPGLQEVLTDDGTAVDDKGLGLSTTDQDVLSDDGLPDLSES